MDGILPGPGQLRTPKHVSHYPSNIPKDRGQQFAQRVKLDDFNRPDGFHPAKQPNITPTTIAEPQAHTQHVRPLERQPRRRPDGSIDLSLAEGAPKPKRKRFRLHLSRPSKKGVLMGGALVFLVVGLIFAKSFWSLGKVFQGGGASAILQDGVDPSKLKGEGDGRVNILLLGKGGDGHTAPDLTDTVLVASIDPINKKASLLSIPRDFWVTPQGLGGMKVNAVYANAKSKVLNGRKIDDQQNAAERAGLDAIENEISEVIGIPIHYHIIIDFEGFKKAIDTVGGIDINVTKQNEIYEVLWDESTGRNYTLDVKAGNQHFNGRRALFYSRSRNVSPRGDFDRTERQRLVIQAFKEKVMSAGTFANPAKVSSLMQNFGDHVRSNLSINEVMRLYDIGKNINGDGIASVGLADPPHNLVQTDSMHGQSVVRPRAGFGEYAAIQNYVRNSLKDGFIANENAKILILNGTTIEGLASRKAIELKSYGYNVINVGTAPTQTYSTTTLVDLRNGSKKYTKRYLEQRLKISAIGRLPDPNIVPGEADFVIILGQNEANGN